MQQLRLHRSVYSVKSDFNNSYSKEAYLREDKLKKWEHLQEEQCDSELIYKVLEVSKATLFRWKKSYKIFGIEGLQNYSRRPNRVRKPIKNPALEQLVLTLRRKYPIFGKDKIKVMLEIEYGFIASVSAVGRILDQLIDQRKIVSVADFCGKKTPRKKRRFDDHAQPFDFTKATKPGEMMQIDHMIEGIYKHFAVICPITKLWYAQVYTKANSANGALFLDELCKFFPFKIYSIQVDGGSEFMADFEELCKQKNIKLYVLPPRSPKLNAFIERSNNTAHYEFYALHPKLKEIDDLKANLRGFVAFYNEIRPHQHLKYLTPMRYFSYWKERNIN